MRTMSTLGHLVHLGKSSIRQKLFSNQALSAELHLPRRLILRWSALTSISSWLENVYLAVPEP